MASTADSHWMRSRIHAATGIGAREYSRSSPPSLSWLWGTLIRQAPR
jgi:hypothetical protein